MSAQRSDEELVSAVRAGDLAAFDALYARYERRLFGYILRLVKDRAAAEDVFQEVFFTVLRDRTFDPDRGRFAPWLLRVARNRCLQDARDGDKHRREPLDEALAAPGDPESAHARAAEVRAAMASLSETQQHLLLLKQGWGLTYAEVATVMGIAEGTVKSRLHGATRAFRARLTKLGAES